MIKKAILIILIILIILLIALCRNQKKPSVNKLIYIAGQEIAFDSLNNPHLSIRRYFEYNQQKDLKIATGHRYYDSIAPILGLDKYYELPASTKLYKIINKTFLNKTYDSTYYGNESRWYYFFIYETPDKKINTIGFTKDALPEELKAINSLLDSLINATDKIQTKKFSVDFLVNELEKKLFRHNPPPPRAIPDRQAKYQKTKQ
jgi:outer membrane protein assembly factor BamE (lipoprotein component of BamABCDE complex)